MNNYRFDIDENMGGCRLKIRWMWMKNRMNADVDEKDEYRLKKNGCGWKENGSE